MADTVIIITGARAIHPAALAALPRDATVIAADTGLDHALAAGLRPEIVVGDFDSVSKAALDWAFEHATVETHPPAKASTDTELAVDTAVGLGPCRIMLVGGGDGTRPDHAITAIGALGRPALAGLALDGWWGSTRYAVVHAGERVELDAPIGAVFSVLALHGPARGVTITGARWDLSHTTLAPLSGLGVSNEAVAPPVVVAVEDGIVTAFVPQPTDAEET